jgi:hypothetical protein
VADLRTTIETEAGGVDPEDIWDLAEELGYTADITWSPACSGLTYEALLRKREHAAEPAAPAARRVDVLRPWHEYGNDPSHQVSSRKLAPELRSFLIDQLPDYMVPGQFVLLDALPLTPGGKLDRKALPEPERARDDGEGLALPRTEVEETLARIWADVLDLESVGVRDNFFELGGDSILSIQIIARANEIGLRLTPKQIFQHQTIAELAAVAGTSNAGRTEQGPVGGTAPLTPIQRWFFEANMPQQDVNEWPSSTWNLGQT